MDRIVKILMKRDNLSKEEAISIMKETAEEINEAIDNEDFDLAEDILMDNLGLEPDYLEDILGV